MSSIDLAIRPLTSTDRDVAVALINRAADWYREFLPPGERHDPEMTPAQWDEEARRLTWYGAFANATLVGVMGLEFVRDAALLRHGYVQPEWQGRGVGLALLRHLETLVPPDRRLLAGTYRANYKAQRLLARAGYTPSVDPERELRTYYAIPDDRLRASLTYEKSGGRSGASSME